MNENAYEILRSVMERLANEQGIVVKYLTVVWIISETTNGNTQAVPERIHGELEFITPLKADIK